MNNRFHSRGSQPHTSWHRGPVGTAASVPTGLSRRSMRRSGTGLRVIGVATVLVLAASACSSPDDSQTGFQDTVPAPLISAPGGTGDDPGDDSDVTAVTGTPATTTTASPVPVASPTTGLDAESGEPAEPAESEPSITMWSTPRLHAAVLSAAWDVTPDDLVCSYDLLDADGSIIGTGVTQISQASRTGAAGSAGRAIQVDYDPAAGEDPGTVAIRCGRGEEDQVGSEYPVHRVVYQNRHPDSVLPASDEYYFDHDEIKVLFPECRAPRNPYLPRPPIFASIEHDGKIISKDLWRGMALDFWEETFENWDTEIYEIEAFVPGTDETFEKQVASGWWTTAQLRMYHPDSTMTADSARLEAAYDEDIELLVLVSFSRPAKELTVNSDWMVAPIKGWHDGRTYYYLKDLYHRLSGAVDYVSESGSSASQNEIARWVRDDGLPGDGPNPLEVRPQYLLWDWTDSRYSFMPIDREPTAWAMRTLLEARDSACVADQMRDHCESGEFHASPHMRNTSHGGTRLGAVLWSTVCPEIRP